MENEIFCLYFIHDANDMSRCEFNFSKEYRQVSFFVTLQ